ncbi:MAG: hypothetical protein J6P93_03285 [Alphaproteobacteria bacterium]|nr:hypothetical protein [Alphaproteobacteria bacterium]
MIERYAFRYTEYQIGLLEKGKMFSDTAADSALMADIANRFLGAPFINGDAPLAVFGIKVPARDEKLQKLTEDVADYGADALRTVLLENKMPLSHPQKAAGWRFADKVWHILKQMDLGNPTDWDKQGFYPVIDALQKQNWKQAWILLKTILNADKVPSGVGFGVYPFMPHLVQSLYPDIHGKMSDFWRFIEQKKLPPRYFVEVNGRRVCDFYPTDINDFEKTKKESLNFSAVQNKIKGKQVQKVINVSGKGLNFVV